MGSLLLTAGEKGMRFSLPNSRIMVHQPSGGYQGQATDILIHARETERLKQRLNEVYVKHTGNDYDSVVKALERDNFMSADEAKAWGLIDEIVAGLKGTLSPAGLRRGFSGCGGADLGLDFTQRPGHRKKGRGNPWRRTQAATARTRFIARSAARASMKCAN
jgi:hypothetical protein